MFNRAVDFVRTNIPDSIKEKATPYVEKATPYYNQAQDKATEYYNQAQSMRTKFVDDATTRVTSLKEQSTNYVNGAAERLDDVLIDNGANKISSKYFGREVVHFHFKEALAKLAERRQQQQEQQEQENNKDNKKTEEEEQKQQTTSSSSIKDRAASSIANMFNNMKSTSTSIVNTVTEKISTNKARLTKNIPTNVQESRQLAVRSVAGAVNFALSSGKYVLEHDLTKKYVPANVTSLAQASINTATPYVEKSVGITRDLDTKYFHGLAFSFVNDVQTQMSSVPEQQQQQKQEETSNTTVDPAAASTATPSAEAQQQQQQEELDQDNF